LATFVRHEPCPACGSRDNLARYSDGSAWCFGCHHTERSADSGFVVGTNPALSEIKEQNVQLSDDLCFDYPGHVVSWLAKYGISVGEAIKHDWKYSPYYDQLVFIFNDGEGNVAVTQARNFNPERAKKRKYYNSGSPADVLPIFHSSPTGHQRKLVVVEDAVSAARIARSGSHQEGASWDAMPCLGSYLPARKIMALKVLNYETLVVWLDADKLKEAREIATMAKWIGLSSRVVYTELDPKEYSDVEITKQLSFPP
jgi:twinkle protein